MSYKCENKNPNSYVEKYILTLGSHKRDFRFEIIKWLWLILKITLLSYISDEIFKWCLAEFVAKKLLALKNTKSQLILFVPI